MKRLFSIGVALCALTTGAWATDDVITYETSDPFEDVVFALENAIIGQGLVIDNVSHTGEMLERTKADVGSDITLFTDAQVFSFCSASLSRKVMEADFMNIRFCPYDIFVYVRPDAPDTTVVGFRTFPEGPMKEVEALLDGIAQSAAEGF
jgi:uncharacterized protein (DUF302 family)